MVEITVLKEWPICPSHRILGNLPTTAVICWGVVLASQTWRWLFTKVFLDHFRHLIRLMRRCSSHFRLDQFYIDFHSAFSQLHLARLIEGRVKIYNIKFVNMERAPQAWSKPKILLDPFRLTPRLMLDGFGLILFWKHIFLITTSPTPPDWWLWSNISFQFILFVCLAFAHKGDQYS